jgi:DNA repair photolyase
VKSRDTANPHNRFRAVAVEYDEGDGPPPSQVTLIDDHSRSILSENDSPDLGFSFSVNPYRGCQSACSYCVSGDTPILLADSRTKPMSELEIGDEILGTTFDGRRHRYIRTRVLDHWRTLKVGYRVALADGTELVASGDHRFLTERGWKHVMPFERDVGFGQRPFLTTNNSLLGTGWFAAAPIQNDEYKRGYLSGMIRGDGLLKRYDYSGRQWANRPRRDRDVQHQFRLALADLEALGRSKSYLGELGVDCFEIDFATAPGNRPMRAIRASSRTAFERITSVIEYPIEPGDDWRRGFLAGIFDAEGSHSDHVLRIANMNRTVIDHIFVSLVHFGFDAVIETIERDPLPIFNVRIRGGRKEHLRFFHSIAPAITRKWSLEGYAVQSAVDLRVVSIERVGLMQLFDITTGTGDFIANGVVSHNCYARPTHEYLDLGAGTDFDTKIVVKREAPALLRSAFDKPSWKGDLVMFSGVTDCYQPVEKELELTRKCLEVCLEYKNPVSVISKHALVERDIDLFLELAKEARFHLSVSLAWTDNELARAMEPWAPSPDKRLKIIETMAKAGVPVGIMCAPIIPGVNDSQLVGLLERAAGAGATWAGWALLRLPGVVKEVFEERVRVALPLAGDKILHRIRETRGGKLYDPTFFKRGRGEGPYAEMIKSMFETTVARLGMNRRDDAIDDTSTTTFRRPPKQTNQLSLF